MLLKTEGGLQPGHRPQKQLVEEREKLLWRTGILQKLWKIIFLILSLSEPGLGLFP
jgi:hypothetical protein